MIPSEEAKIPHAWRAKNPKHKTEAHWNKLSKTLKVATAKKKKKIFKIKKLKHTHTHTHQDLKTEN